MPCPVTIQSYEEQTAITSPKADSCSTIIG